MENISDHITYFEATNSYTAKKRGIDNTPNDIQLSNMKRVAKFVFEPMRENFGIPIYLPSFFRCEKLNEFIGGAEGSQHMAIRGAAIDADADRYGRITNKDIFDFIYFNINYDQLIWEFGTTDNPDWVHASYIAGENRKEALRAYRRNKKGIYISFDLY
ncbi:hypothetical protein ES703_32265 [subsurface metagenome]